MQTLVLFVTKKSSQFSIFSGLLRGWQSLTRAWYSPITFLFFFFFLLLARLHKDDVPLPATLLLLEGESKLTLGAATAALALGLLHPSSEFDFLSLLGDTRLGEKKQKQECGYYRGAARHCWRQVCPSQPH